MFLGIEAKKKNQVESFVTTSDPNRNNFLTLAKENITKRICLTKIMQRLKSHWESSGEKEDTFKPLPKNLQMILESDPIVMEKSHKKLSNSLKII